MTVLYYLDMFGTFAFALSGALLAVKKDMDLFGMMVLALVTAVGGGTLRDMMLGQTPVFILTDPTYVYVSIAAALCTFFLSALLFRINSIIMIADAFGLGTFVCIGVSKALAADISTMGAVILGLITAVMGGMIRDVLAGDIPAVLTRDFYATVCVIGGLIYTSLYQYLQLSEDQIMLVTASTVIVIRLLAIRFKWNLVKVKNKPTQSLGV